MSETIVEAGLASVGSDYRHRPKLITHAGDMVMPGIALKWYDIQPAESPVPESEQLDAREHVAGEIAAGRLSIAGELGFVILHRVTAGYLLLVSTWRQNNEIWESVYAKPIDGTGYESIPQGAHKGTFCVWEMAVAWHESHAWTRYLYSERDDNARRNYLDDRFTGVV